MASFRSAFMLAVLLSATASALLGCGEKKDTSYKELGVYLCYCEPSTPEGPRLPGTQVYMNKAFTPCDCTGGGGAAGTGTVSQNGGAAGTGLADGVPPKTTDTVNAGDSQAGAGGTKGSTKEVVPDGKCPKGFTCAFDQVYKTKTMCMPSDPNTLLCAVDDDCKKIGLEVICMNGPGFNLCVKFCEP